MELGKTPIDREPIRYNIEEFLIHRNNPSTDPVRDLESDMAFRGVSVGNELHDVAIRSGGIDAEGNLDPGVLDAVEKTASYLEGRQGQPVFYVQTISDHGRLVRIDGSVATLDTTDKLVGIFKGRLYEAGIKVAGSVYELESYVWPDSGILNLERSVARTHDVMPLTPRFQDGFGKPADHSDRELEGRTHTQDIIAGPDILPWIDEHLPTPQARYELFTGIAQGIQSASAAKYILRGDYTEMVETERRRLAVLNTLFEQAAEKIERYEQAAAAVKSVLSAELNEIHEAAGDQTSRIPNTQDSWRARVTSDVESVRDIRSRQHAVNWMLNNYVNRITDFPNP
ncbi:MAG: hypothetical protein JWN38_1086 [Candidatus Saccharibacteria bacterium]|nr:hypothetical protein [Candidatus Saccharibacteria bacterium]